MRPPPLVLTVATRALLERLARLPTTSQRTALRARIVLLAHAGHTHKGPAVAAWQAEHPGRLQLHYLPFYARWLNQIEMWFATLQRRLLPRGDFDSAEELEAQILAFIATYNRLHAHPYRWTYTGEPLVA